MVDQALRQAPFGALIVVFRRIGHPIEYLLLHRAHAGPEYTGEWAWGPPGGSREPGETIDECAARELREETGLSLSVHRVAHPDTNWRVYTAEAPAHASIALSDEHDRWVWVSGAEALSLTSPAIIVAELKSALRVVEPPQRD